MGGGGPGAGAKGEGGHTAMVADILKEKEKAEERAKEANAEAKRRGDGQVRHLCHVPHTLESVCCAADVRV